MILYTPQGVRTTTSPDEFRQILSSENEKTYIFFIFINQDSFCSDFVLQVLKRATEIGFAFFWPSVDQNIVYCIIFYHLEQDVKSIRTFSLKLDISPYPALFEQLYGFVLIWTKNVYIKEDKQLNPSVSFVIIAIHLICLDIYQKSIGGRTYTV